MQVTDPERPSDEVWPVDVDLGAGWWERGTDFLGPWSEAHAAIEAFDRAVRDAGLDWTDFRVVASTDACGAAVVRGRMSAAIVRELARLVRRGAGLPAVAEKSGVRGARFLGPRGEGEAAMAMLHRALEEAGVVGSDLRTVASAGAAGRGILRGWGSAAFVREVARLIRVAAGLPADETGVSGR